MNQKTKNFNLLDEEWIPVLYRDGKRERVGIRKALEDAGKIRQIAASNPMDRVAILRFLLALLYWCKGNPPTNMDIVSNGEFPSEWFSKLDAHKDCFNLLGEGKRFYQDRDAHRPRAVTDLLQEIPSGNNFWHLRHSIDKKDGLCLACCAVGLLRLPLFSVSGLSGPGEPNLMAGINGVPPIYVVPLGAFLLETLTASWSPCMKPGVPAWVNPRVCTEPGKDVPVLLGLTLLSRRVFLHEPDKQADKCIGCGAKGMPIILTCEFQTAGRQENELWNDPHVVYRKETKRKALRAQDLTKPGTFRMDRPWPDVITHTVETNRPAVLLIVGFATNKAKNIDVWERTLELPSLESVRKTAVDKIKKWQKEGKGLARKMRPPGKTTPSRKHVEIASVVAAIRPHVEDRVSAKAGDLLAGGDEGWEQAEEEYRSMMEVVARSLSPGFTTGALQWRKQIAGAVPDMRPRAESAKKPARKKGGRT